MCILWIYSIAGLLPSVLDGVVTRKVCTRTFTDLCEEFWNIDMKNCTDFYVYQLKASLRAKAAYCFGKRPKKAKCCDM